MDLDRSFGFLVNDVARLFGRRFLHNGRRLGLTRAQCRTLARIARHEGINQAGLADLLEVRPMTLVRQIDRMEDAGWIERRPDPADRRKIWVHAVPFDEERVAAAYAAILEHMDEVHQGFTVAELQTVLRYLDEIKNVR